MAIDSKLRGYDLVKIKFGDLVSDIRIRALPIQQNGGKPLFLDCQAAGVAFCQALRSELWARALSSSAIRMEI